MTLNELEKKHQKLSARMDKDLEKGKDIASESKRVADVATNAPRILNDLDREFESITKLNAIDVSFLFLATALQVARQYLLTKFPERMSDKDAAQKTWGHHEEHSDRKHRYYNPSLEEIISNPVPFDANRGANGALRGGGFMGHRVTALGHDPILGLFFGTCNIATSTLTNKSFESFHIYTAGKTDAFRNRASTALVIKKSGEKLINQGFNGKLIIATSLIKEIIHLRSDARSNNSLPLPIVSAIDGELAARLANYGLDMINIATVSKQATVSLLINSLIAMIHGLFAPDDLDEKIYMAKTRKILLYSNMIASYSNLIYVGANAAAGNEYALRNLDVGGLLVTIYRIATDIDFIEAAKREFITNKFFEQVHGIKEDV